MKLPFSYRKPTWEEAVQMCVRCPTPRQACLLVRRYLSYRAELKDVWSPARETWSRGYGDCEDLAACVRDLCRAAHLSACGVIFWSVLPGVQGHAVAIGKIGRQVWMSSNGHYELFGNRTELKQRVALLLGCPVGTLYCTTLPKEQQCETR